MRPRWHILLGAILTAVVWLTAPQINPIYLVILFLSSFLMDFDHFLASSLNTKNWNLKKSFKYHDEKMKEEKKEIAKGIRKKSDFHIFHTLEFHFLVGLLTFVWVGFFYVFIGMVFHSLTDVIDLIRKGAFHRREFFFFKWFQNLLD